MRQVIEQLAGLLTEQRSVLTDMLVLSREKRRIIVECETEKLEQVVRLEMRELSKLGGIEKKRAALNKALAVQLDLPENDITVSAIASRLQPDECDAITDLQKVLTTLIEQHAQLNAENRELIKAHLEYSEAMLEVMTDSEDPLNSFYGGDGKALDERKKTTGFIWHYGRYDG